MDTLVTALSRADAAAISACFTEAATLRALTPPGLHEREGAAAIGELMASWFADCEQLELVSTSHSKIVDRDHIGYRFAGVKAGRGHCVIEQQLYVEMDGERFANVALVCSGFRPTG